MFKIQDWRYSDVYMLNTDKTKFVLNYVNFTVLKLMKINNKVVLVFNGPKNSINFIKIPKKICVFKRDSFLEFFVKDNQEYFLLNNFKNKIDFFMKKNYVFKDKLRINGLGFKITRTKEVISLKLGYSHKILIKIPKEIRKFSSQKKKIKIESLDRIKLGNFTRKICSLRKADAYKGKGFSFWNTQQTLKEIKKK